MKPEHPLSAPGANEEVSALIETLHQTGQRLEDLTAGQVDTVTDRRGRTVLLRRAQDHLRHNEAAKQMAILNALPAHIALLDAQGFILSVNEAWRRFASDNVLQSASHQIGLNYLEICDSANGADACEAHQATAGIRAVLAGEVSSFSLEYPCHSPTEQRWFMLIVTPLVGGHPSGAVVTHLNITERTEAQARIRRLNRVHAVLSGINTLIVRVRERDELFHQACRIAVEAGAFKMAWIGVLEPHTLDGKVVAWHGGEQGFVDQIKLTLRDGMSEHERPACRALRLGQAVICNDIATEPSLAPLRDELLSRGYQSLGSFPLSVAGRPEAVIALFAGEPDFFDDQEVALLLELADNLSFALEHLENEKRLAHLDMQRKQGEAALRRFSAAMDATADAIYLVDRTSMRFIHVNDAACRMQGRTGAQLLALEPWVLLSTSRAELERTYDTLIASGADAAPLELLRQRQDGAQAWVELRRHAQQSSQGWTIITLVRDITERKKTEANIVYLSRVHAVLSRINTLIVRVRERDELFKQACLIAVEAGGFRMAWIGIIDTSVMKLVPVASAGVATQTLNAIKNRFAASEAVSQGTSMVARALRGKTTVVANNSQNDPQLTLPQEHAKAGIHSLAVLPLIVADEAVGVLALYAREIEFFQEEELKLLTGLASDIAFAIDHISKQEQLDYLAYYDALTGLANRRLFLDRVAQHLRNARSGGHQLAVILLDLERFKNINDSLGWAAGDELLRQVVEWLTHIAGDVNLLARVGTDQFAAVLPVLRPDGDLARLLDKQLEALQGNPFHLIDAVFRIAAKVGVALFPDDAADADTLLRNAEAALKKAKSRGERYQFYTQAMTVAVTGQLTLENQLRQALDNGEFVLHYQPKVNLASGMITSAEALIRWNDPRTGLVPPGQFIPILEETGLIYEVGRWALRQAVKDYLCWLDAGLPAVRIAVNVSPLQLRHRGFIAEVKEVINLDARAAAGLELEITESVIMEDIRHNIASLEAIRAMGVRIAIDDFGTGFSSLSYLAKLPLDTLKIDRSFVIDMTAGPQGLALVSTIINLAHALALKVVAEGVETEEQSRLLRVLGCDEMQGYLFSKPVPGEIFAAKFLVAPTAG